MPFLVTLQADEDGGYVAEGPALPGCLSHGETLDEAMQNIREAIALSLSTRRELGLPLAVEVREVEVAA